MILEHIATLSNIHLSDDISMYYLEIQVADIRHFCECTVIHLLSLRLSQRDVSSPLEKIVSQSSQKLS